jgi:ABC-type transport system involved in cytochrome bd biosynthesis fused ATPase/permease subunit
VMKVGLDAGLIGPEMFTLLLLLAIITTLMTGPLLGLSGWRSPRLAAAPGTTLPK